MPSIVTVSPTYQITIPSAVRQALKLRPGWQFQVIAYEDHVQLIPLRPIREMRGFLAGIDTRIPRDPEREVTI